MSAEQSELYSIIAKRIRLARTEAHLTQKAVGRAAGIEIDELSRIETGKRRPAVWQLVAIARALHKPLGYFLGEDTSGEPPLFVDHTTDALDEIARFIEYLRDKYAKP